MTDLTSPANPMKARNQSASPVAPVLVRPATKSGQPRLESLVSVIAGHLPDHSLMKCYRFDETREKARRPEEGGPVVRALAAPLTSDQHALQHPVLSQSIRSGSAKGGSSFPEECARCLPTKDPPVEDHPALPVAKRGT